MAGSSPTGVDVADKQTRLDLKHFHSWVFVRIMGMINQNILGIRFDKIDFVWINSKIYEIENLRSSKHRLPLIGGAGHQVLSNSWSSFPHLSSLKDYKSKSGVQQMQLLAISCTSLVAWKIGPFEVLTREFLIITSKSGINPSIIFIFYLVKSF